MKPRSVHSLEYQLLVSKIREIRANSGLTQRALAAKLHKYHSYVSRIETSERELNVVELMDYCDALGIDSVDFIHDLRDQINKLRKDSPRSR